MSATETEVQPDNVLDVSEQIENQNGANGANGIEEVTPDSNRDVSRWGKTAHVFATPHPAHEFLSDQTGYTRDKKDEEGNVVNPTPEGFTRKIIGNLVPTELHDSVKRLCKMHNVDLEDELRFAMNAMFEALQQNLVQRPVPEGWKDTPSITRTKLTDEQKAESDRIKAEVAAQKKALAEEAKAQRDALSAKRTAMIEEHKAKLAALKGEVYVPKQPDATGATHGLQTLGSLPEPERVAPPTPAPMNPVTSDSEGNEEQSDRKSKK